MNNIPLREMLDLPDAKLASVLRDAINYHLSQANSSSDCDQTMSTLDKIKDSVVVIGIINKEVIG
ncbi:hypothetical protein [Psychrobacter aquimaris]|uniref:hypothetical protein n=1 Tax=Psychrobacter aquimaris TaxID=292733 RepID=UPI0018DF38A2|nr:hypothetical protein [Psychrobacter aquimaris]